MGTLYDPAFPEFPFGRSVIVDMEIGVLPCLPHLFSSQDSYFFWTTFSQDETWLPVVWRWLSSVFGLIVVVAPVACCFDTGYSGWVLKPSGVQGGLAGPESLRGEDLSSLSYIKRAERGCYWGKQLLSW